MARGELPVSGSDLPSAHPLLTEPLRLEHVKPRLLGHWSTTPGLNFIYVHLNRIIKQRDQNVLFVAGPGHGAPGVIANAGLKGTYCEVYPEAPQHTAGFLDPPAHSSAKPDRIQRPSTGAV